MLSNNIHKQGQEGTIVQTIEIYPTHLQQNLQLLMVMNKLLRRKIKRSVTDSLGVISYNDEQPGIKNLLEIYSKLGNKSIEELVAMYEGKGYGIFKEDVAEVIVESLRPIREQYNDLLNNKDYLEKVYAIGAEKAERQARKTLRKVYKKVGLIERKFL